MGVRIKTCTDFMRQIKGRPVGGAERAKESLDPLFVVATLNCSIVHALAAEFEFTAQQVFPWKLMLK